MMAEEQLSLEGIAEKTKDDLWDAQFLGDLRTYKYLLTEAEARSIILALRTGLNNLPGYKLEDARDNLDERILWTVFVAPLAHAAYSPELIRDVKILIGALELPLLSRIVPEHSHVEFAKMYYIDSSSPSAVKVRDNRVEKKYEHGPPGKKLLVIETTDVPGSQEKALLVMNVFYSAYCAVRAS